MLFETGSGRFAFDTSAGFFLRAPIIGEVFIQTWPHDFKHTRLFDAWRDGNASHIRLGRVELVRNK